jgi:hypothetical protein
MDRASGRIALMVAAVLLALVAGCSADGGSQVPATPGGISAAPSGQIEPLYYAFAFDPVPGSPGCGPQARFVKVVGTEFFEVAGYGCDGSADRGTIRGDEVALVGKVYVCGGEGTESYPSVMEISGGAEDLRIPGETRVVGPTTSLEDLDVWWSEENERVKYPSERDSSNVSEWMVSAAADDWIGNGC